MNIFSVHFIYKNTLCIYQCFFILFNFTRSCSAMALLFIAHINEVLHDYAVAQSRCLCIADQPGLHLHPKWPYHCTQLFWFMMFLTYYFGKSDIYFHRGNSDHIVFIRHFPGPHLHLTFFKVDEIGKENYVSHIFIISLAV